jgi:hypothetical protein
MKPAWNKLWIGFVLGMIAPLIVLAINYKVNNQYFRLSNFDLRNFITDVLSPLISLCVIANLGVFYLFIRKDYYNGARGVVMATFIYAIAVFAVKLLY